MPADALTKDVERQRRIVGIRPHLRPAWNGIELIRRHEVQLAQHLAVDIPQLPAIGKSQSQARFARARGSRGSSMSQKRPASIGFAASSFTGWPSRSKGSNRNLPRRRAWPSWRPLRASRSAGVARSRMGVGAVASATVLPAAARRQLLGDDGQIGQFRHGGGPLTVWYATPALQQTTS